MAVFFFFFQRDWEGESRSSAHWWKAQSFKTLVFSESSFLFFPIVTVCVVGEDGGQAGLFGC